MKVVSLSKAQERIWLECQLNPQNVAYNNPLLYALRGPLKIDCLRKALERIVVLQPSLRSYFITQAGIPKQVIITIDDIEILQMDDISSLPKEEQQLRLQQWILENARCQFELSQLPLFRFSLLKIGADDYRLLLNIHHIVIDGYSAHLLIESISTYYEQFLTGQSSEVMPYDQTYVDYCETSQREEDSLEAIAFWQEQFEDANIHVDLFRNENSAIPADAGQRDYFSISAELSQRLKQLAKQHKTTEFTLLMSAFYIVLGYYANQDDIIIGYPLDVRPLACREVFGFFVNNIPLRVRLSPNQTLHVLIQQLNHIRKKIKPHQKTDLKDIIRYVRASSPSHPDSLYNVSFVRANFAKSGLKLINIEVEPQLISTDAVKDELCLLFDENQEKKSFEFAIEYNKKCYAQDLIQHLKTAYKLCLQNLLEVAEKPIKELSLHTHLPQPAFGVSEPFVDDFIERFLTHVKQIPQKNAVISSSEVLSYQALYEDVIDWRERLEPLIDHHKPVIVCLNRSSNVLSLLLALQWMDITYIPVDVSTPSERLCAIIEDSGAGVCICDDKQMRLSDSCLFLSQTSLKNEQRRERSVRLTRLTCNPIAYVIYTSGSTGTPKGVKVSRLALNNFLHGMAQHFMQEENNLFLAITTIAFDIAGLELFLPIWQGKTVLLANQTQHKDPFKIAELLNQYPVTHLQATPAMWQMLSNVGWKAKSELVALCGGEALSKSLAHDLLSKVSVLWNMYGPTEATIWCALKRVDKEGAITVGQPIVNMNMRVLDAELRILPPFVKGELYIGGVGLAEEYVNRPELTEKQFIKYGDERLYRVGDVACIDAKGEFILFGRTDNQIKLNGYRIELGEIESHIQNIEEVSNCAVLVVHNQLIAYISLKKDRVLPESAFFSALEKMLPDYMLPKQCLFLETFPLTASGKLDKKALPVSSLQPQEDIQPSHAIETELLDLWESVLLKKPTSVVDHFYHLGGHSLLVLQLVVQINAHFKRNFSMVDMLNHLTIRKQAELIKHSISESLPPVMKTEIKKAPFTAAQRRIWFTSQLMPHEATYHMAAKLTLHGELDIPRLERAIFLLANRQEVLRAIIEIEEGEPWQCIQEKSTIQLERLYSLSEQICLDWVARPFKANQVWWRVALHSTQGEHHILICIHHAIADGYSVSLFLKELFAFYQEKNLPVIQHRYLDDVLFELSKKESSAHLSFWKTELLESTYLELPCDQSDDDLSSARINQMLDVETWSAIRQYGSEKNISISSILMAAFAWLMHRWSKQSDFCIGVPIARRENQVLHDKVGCFMDILPMRLSVSKQQTFSEWIDYVERQFANALSHFVPFSSLLSQLQLERHDAFSPLFPVVINIQPHPFENLWVDGLMVQVQPIHVHTDKYPLSLDIYFSNEKAECYWDYAAGKFKQDTINFLSRQFNALLSDFISMSDKIMVSEATLVPSKKITAITFEREIFRAPESLLQQMVALIWQTVLGIPQIGLSDHFFRLGGHSFLASRMISDLTAHLSHSIPMELVFRFPILADFCNAIEALPKEQVTRIIDDKVPLVLTPNQHQMVLALKEKPHETYHVSVLIIKEFWDVQYLEILINELIAKHTVYKLYLTASMTLTETTQPMYVAIEVCDMDASQSVLDWAKLKNKTPIDLSQAPLLRVSVAKGVEDGLLLTLHHLIADESALHMFATALLDRYEGGATPWGSSCWHDHAHVWSTPDVESTQYWRQYLSVFQPSVIPSTQQSLNREALHASKRISASTIRNCENLAQKSGSTLFHIMLSIFVYYVRQFSCETSVAIAVTYDRRYSKVLQNLQGYLVNLLPLVCDIDTFETWSALLESIKTDHLLALEKSNIDYAYLLAQGLVSSPAIVFNYQHQLSGFDAHQDLKWHEVSNQQARFPATFHLRKDLDGEMSIVIEYESSNYDADFIQTILTAFVELVERFPQQYQLPLRYWSFGTYNVPPALSLEVVALTEYPGMDIDYQGVKKTRELLWQDVSKFAYALQTREHLEPGEIVGIALSDRYAYVVSLLGVLRIGGAFLPIDVNLPIERQQFIIKDSAARLVVDEERFKAWMILSSGAVDVVGVDECLPAYIIYTSGTTGLPKGTMISRRALQTFISGLQNQLKINVSDRILHFSSPSFDASIWEIFLALVSGASLVIPNESERRVGAGLEQFIKKQSITHAILTPSVLNTLNVDAMPSLRVVASGGEPCTANLIAQWVEHCEFYNAYGPTEATVCVALERLTSQSQPNCIGTALGQAKLMVVSQALLPLPAGAIGELLIGGPILAENYLNQPELSEKRFILLDGQRWYRSGDRVRQMVSGKFEYIGREDLQIKLRGLRIELGEIEAAICILAHATSACCIVQDEQLVIYVTADVVLNEIAVLAQLAKKLPSYMVPARMIQMNTFPLLPSGKVNIKAFPPISKQETALIKPRTAEEHAIFEIWSKHLNRIDLGIHQDFFRLGGNSLQAMNIATDLEKHFSIDISLQFFYTHSTIAKQSEYMTEEQNSSKQMDDWLSQLSEAEKQALLESLSV